MLNVILFFNILMIQVSLPSPLRDMLIVERVFPLLLLKSKCGI